MLVLTCNWCTKEITETQSSVRVGFKSENKNHGAASVGIGAGDLHPDCYDEFSTEINSALNRAIVWGEEFRDDVWTR